LFETVSLKIIFELKQPKGRGRFLLTALGHKTKNQSPLERTMAWRGQPKKSKLVVRGLPHALGETDFRQLVKDHLAAVDFFAYFPGRKRFVQRSSFPSSFSFVLCIVIWECSSNGVVTASRAFLNFTDQEALFKFSEAFQGHTFVDARGMLPYSTPSHKQCLKN
jgi:hypothetical protein